LSCIQLGLLLIIILVNNVIVTNQINWDPSNQIINFKLINIPRLLVITVELLNAPRLKLSQVKL